MKDRGFSLLEVLVALTVIGFGFAAVFAGMSGSLRGLGRAEETERRIELARMKLAELDLIKSVQPNDTAEGQFEDGTHWRLQTLPFIKPIQDGPQPNPSSLIQIDLTLEWMAHNGVQKRVIQTYRYVSDQTSPAPSLREQLHEIE